MTDHICPGRCNARYRREQAAYDTVLTQWQTAEEAAATWRHVARAEGLEGPEPPRWDRPEPPAVRAWAGEPIWCERCTASLRRCLADLDELLPLRVAMTDGYQTAGEQLVGRVHGTNQKTPSPSPGQDDLDDIVRWLRGWEGALRESQGWITVPYRGVSAPALTSSVSWMLTHLDLLLDHEDMAKPFGLELLREHARLEKLTSTRPPLTHKPLPCPGRDSSGQPCRRRSLFLHEDGLIRCSNDNCRRVMSEDEYAALEEQATQQVAS